MLNSYLIKHADIMNIFTGTCERKDILVENGIITAMGDSITCTAGEVIDASGFIVTPGWVDDHAHLYYDSPNHIGVNPQTYFLPYGVTYAIDPGTAGADNFRSFREYVRWNTDLKYRSYLNISKIGIPIYGYDLTDMSNLDETACRNIFREFHEELIGLKVRITSNMCTNPLKALETIRKLCDELNTHFCVHATRCDLPAENIFEFLKKGDMITHSYARTSSGILDENGHIRTCVWEARDRGVIFDMGHGINSFSFSTARRAMKQGFLLDTLSTDLHISDVSGPVYDMPTTLSKFLALGLDLPEVIRMVTVNPVRLLGLPDKSLSVTPGEPADFTAFEIKKGNFRDVDCHGEVLESSVSLESKFTCVANKIFTPRLRRESNRAIGNAAIQERLQQKDDKTI